MKRIKPLERNEHNNDKVPHKDRNNGVNRSIRCLAWEIDSLSLKTLSNGTRNCEIQTVQRNGSTRNGNIEMREQQRSIFKQITPVAQALEMTKSEIKCKRKENDSESMTVGKRQRKKYELELIQIFK